MPRAISGSSLVRATVVVRGNSQRFWGLAVTQPETSPPYFVQLPTPPPAEERRQMRNLPRREVIIAPLCYTLLIWAARLIQVTLHSASC